MDLGHTERGIPARVDDERFVRVRRGWYIGTQVWEKLWPEGRHLLHIVAVSRDAVGQRPVFSGLSAAVVHGLPIYRTTMARVHVAAERRTSRSMRDVLRHETTLDPGDVVEIDGLLCTSLTRTVLDVTRVASPEAALACADAVLRRVAVSGQAQDEELASAWREELLARAGSSTARGIRQSRRTIAFADGRAQLPGETVSRLQLWRLGFRRIGLQRPIVAADGSRFFIDFELDEADAFGEFDGRGKYVDEALREGMTADEVVLAEKQREDWVRGVTGRRFVRWGSEHIKTSAALGERLAAFGIHPPSS